MTTCPVSSSSSDWHSTVPRSSRRVEGPRFDLGAVGRSPYPYVDGVGIRIGDALLIATRSGDGALAREMSDTLAHYEHRQPSSHDWREDGGAPAL